MKEKKFVKICPQCGSTNIGPGIGRDIPGTNCYDCGYGNPQKKPITVKFKVLPGYEIFPEIEESKIKSFQARLNKKNKK